MYNRGLLETPVRRSNRIIINGVMRTRDKVKRIWVEVKEDMKVVNHRDCP